MIRDTSIATASIPNRPTIRKAARTRVTPRLSRIKRNTETLGFEWVPVQQDLQALKPWLNGDHTSSGDQAAARAPVRRRHDPHVDFLFARTGELAWETQILDYRLGGQASSGPIVGGGKVISGRSCAPRGGPEGCVITAFDALTGEEAWRTYTIPRPGEPGFDTWGDVPYEERRHVGT